MPLNLHLTTIAVLRGMLQTNSAARTLRLSGMLVLVMRIASALIPTASNGFSDTPTNTVLGYGLGIFFHCRSISPIFGFLNSFAACMYIVFISLAWGTTNLLVSWICLHGNLDHGDNVWTVGQYLPLLLASLPVMPLIEESSGMSYSFNPRP